MSLDKFITQVLNIKEDDLGEILPIEQSDGTLVIKLKLRFMGITREGWYIPPWLTGNV